MGDPPELINRDPKLADFIWPTYRKLNLNRRGERWWMLFSRVSPCIHILTHNTQITAVLDDHATARRAPAIGRWD